MRGLRAIASSNLMGFLSTGHYYNVAACCSIASSSLAAVSSRPNINYLKEKFSDHIIINDAVRELNKESAKTSVNKIHVLEPLKENWDVIRDLAYSGVQEEAFYILDVDEILSKHNDWRTMMPRVAPFYGNFLLLLLKKKEFLSFYYK